MSDDSSKKVVPTAAPSVNYDVRRLAEETGISIVQALALIAKHGDDPETLVREANRLKGIAPPSQ
jgi:hypothetical protein